MENSQLHKKKEEQEQLLARLRLGDEAAMKLVFQEYYWRLHYFSIKLISNEADAEDIVQEAFLNFWVSIREKDLTVSNLQAYLYRMVRNRCVNYLERKRMIGDRNGEVIEQFYHKWERRMDEVAVQEELFQRIIMGFSYLTPVQTQVMELLYEEGLSVAEVAVQLNTTVNNIRNHKARALERLKTVLKTGILLAVLFFLIFF